jgi:hypothetical protein
MRITLLQQVLEMLNDIFLCDRIIKTLLLLVLPYFTQFIRL